MLAFVAAIRAGYSVATAEQIAYQLLQKTSVLAAITAARKAQQERTQINADRVVTEAWQGVAEHHMRASSCLAAGSFAHNDSCRLMGTLALTSPENLHALLHRRCSDVAFRLI